MNGLGNTQIEWTCLDCGSHGIKTGGWPSLTEKAWAAVIIQHDVLNPGCRGAPESLRAHELTDDEISANLRAG